MVRLGLMVALLALVPLTPGCARDSSATRADAASDGVDAGTSVDVGTPGSCLHIRACASQCADAACRQRCVDQGSTPERALYEQLEACTRAACPDDQDTTCRCEVECVFPGACTDLQDMCSQGVDDPRCVRCF